MKLFYVFLLPLVLIGMDFSMKAQTTGTDVEKSSIKKESIDVYYFHNTRRCATCEAVESVTKTTLEEEYAEQMKDGGITFQSLNIEDNANESLARKLHVSGQTLLIVKGKKKRDLTNDAFLYARSNPEKLEARIVKVINDLSL